MYAPLTPARFELDAEGAPFSPEYEDIYHSREGGPGQAQHVFIAGNDLPARWQERARFVILETGFGTGLNFLATWAAWRNDPRACQRLHFISAEKHPFHVDDLARLHADWPEYGKLAERLRADWPTLTPGFHRLEFEQGALVLTLLFGDAGITLPKLHATVDAFYLDGFSPARSPALWSPALMRQIARLAGRAATLATWSVSVPVIELLEKAGFDTGKRPGFGRKKEMLVGHLRLDRPVRTQPDRHAIVVGAGVAGSTCCERLASRGWHITLIDSQPGPAMAASGNLAGILMPLVSRDDNIASRLSRQAYLHALRVWNKRPAQAAGARLAACGVMQFARNAAQDALMQEAVKRLAFPETFLRYLTRAEAGTMLGHAVPAGGWFFPQGGWANPPSLCRAALSQAGQHIETRFGQRVTSAIRTDGAWRILDDRGNPLGEAPHLILANGIGITDIEQGASLPIRPVRGQVTLIPQDRLPPLNVALCGEGYATPAVDGLHAVGASYDHDLDPEPRAECDRENLHRLAGLLPGHVLDDTGFASRVGFRPVSPDRLPSCGTLPDQGKPPRSTADRLADLARQPGLHGLFGYASRGLVWSALLAENLASELEGEPLPLESDLADTIDPARFSLRAARKGL